MMINDNFIAPSINIESICDEAKGLDIVTGTRRFRKIFLILLALVELMQVL